MLFRVVSAKEQKAATRKEAELGGKEKTKQKVEGREERKERIGERKEEKRKREKPNKKV